MMQTRCFSGWIKTVTAVALLAGSYSSAQTADGLRYKIYYQCNGERVSVAYCRKDSDMAGMPPTKPQDDYCLVYYPDRPRRNGIMVQAAELRADIVKKLQACGALVASPTSDTSSDASTAKTYYDEGRNYYQAKDYLKAIPYFREAVRLKPNDADAWSMLGSSYYLLQQYQDALNAFQECARLAPNNPAILFMLGAGYARVGNKQAALEVYRKLQSIDQKQAQNLDLVINKVFATPVTGRMPATSAPASASSSSAAAYVAQGNKYYEAKNYDAALQACKSAIALRPDSKTLASAYYCVANSYQGLDQYQENVLALQEALRLEPGQAGTYFGLGWGYYNLKQYQNALTNFKESARLKPDDDQSWYWIAETYRIGLKQSENALAPFREALRLQPNNARTNGELGYAYYDLKQYDKAVAAFQQTVRVKADYADGWAGLGYAYDKLYDFEKAQAAFQQAVRLKPDNATFQFYLGYSYAWSVDLGEKALLPKAIAAFKEAIRLKPDYVDAYSWLGSMYAENGRKDEALQVYKTLLTLNKTEAEKLLDEINEPVSSQRSSSTSANPTKTNTASAKTPAQSAPSAQARPNQPSSQPSAATPQARQLMVLGSVQESSGQSDKALESFRRAIALNPDAGTLAEAYIYLGSLYDDRKEYGKAVASLREALRFKIVPADEVHANYLLGVAYLGLGQKTHALEVYKTLQSLDKAEADRLNRQIQEAK